MVTEYHGLRIELGSELANLLRSSRKLLLTFGVRKYQEAWVLTSGEYHCLQGYVRSSHTISSWDVDKSPCVW